MASHMHSQSPPLLQLCTHKTSSSSKHNHNHQVHFIHLPHGKDSKPFVIDRSTINVRSFFIYDRPAERVREERENGCGGKGGGWRGGGGERKTVDL